MLSPSAHRRQEGGADRGFATVRRCLGRAAPHSLEAGYNGAFRLSYAGQYQDHNALFNQARGSVKVVSKDGLFLAGEGVSWEGGWRACWVTQPLHWGNWNGGYCVRCLKSSAMASPNASR